MVHLRNINSVVLSDKMSRFCKLVSGSSIGVLFCCPLLCALLPIQARGEGDSQNFLTNLTVQFIFRLVAQRVLIIENKGLIS